MSQVETIRAFIAVPIPEEIKQRFRELQRKLKSSRADVRWVKPENAHITLHFLGDTPVDKLNDIESALRQAAASQAPFEVSIDGLGVFPNERRPRVVWIGISRGANSLAALQSSVSREIRRLGFKTEDREYSPHITLGRVKGPTNLTPLLGILDANRTFQAGTFRAAHIHLIRSILSSEGPTYSTLFSSDLQQDPFLQSAEPV